MRKWPASRRTSSPPARRRRRARCSPCTAAGSWRRSAPGRSGTPPGWRPRSALGSAPRLPACARALLARQPRGRRRTGRALGRGGRRHRAGRRLVGRWVRPGARPHPARPRRAAADPPASPRAVGRPDDEHPRDGRPTTRSTRGCSSARCARTPGGGPACPRTWAGPRSAPALADLNRSPPAPRRSTAPATCWRPAAGCWSAALPPRAGTSRPWSGPA